MILGNKKWTTWQDPRDQHKLGIFNFNADGWYLVLCAKNSLADDERLQTEGVEVQGQRLQLSSWCELGSISELLLRQLEKKLLNLDSTTKISIQPWKKEQFSIPPVSALRGQLVPFRHRQLSSTATPSGCRGARPRRSHQGVRRQKQFAQDWKIRKTLLELQKGDTSINCIPIFKSRGEVLEYFCCSLKCKKLIIYFNTSVSNNMLS